MMSGKLFDALEVLFIDRADRMGPSSLNKTEAALALTRSFQLEMNNGGFWSFFYNSTGRFARDTPRGLQAINARRSAELLQSAIDLYLGDRHDLADDEERRKWVEDRNADQTPEADALNSAFFDADEPLLDMLDLYLPDHFTDFRIYDGETVLADRLEDGWRLCTKCFEAWEQPPELRLGFCVGCESLTVLGYSQPGVI